MQTMLSMYVISLVIVTSVVSATEFNMMPSYPSLKVMLEILSNIYEAFLSNPQVQLIRDISLSSSVSSFFTAIAYLATEVYLNGFDGEAAVMAHALMLRSLIAMSLCIVVWLLLSTVVSWVKMILFFLSSVALSSVFIVHKEQVMDALFGA